VLDALPETHVELIEGCGHCPQLEATEQLLELLLAFPA
jgi:pimeloyl-ACP methyl ester carboxylesterase